MPTVIAKALDFINAMDTTVSVPNSMDESTAKGIFKYLKEIGVQVSADDIAARGASEGWNPEFTKKVVGWAQKIASEDHVVIKNPEYFSAYMQEQLSALV